MDTIQNFDNSYKFYLIKEDNKFFVLAVKIYTDNSIDKIKYSLQGTLIKRVKDVMCNGFIKIISGEKTVMIKDGKVLQIENRIKLKAIPKPVKRFSIVEDNNIGVIDTEIYTDNNGIVKVYALGYYTILDKEPVMYYVDKKERDNSKLILELVDELLIYKYDKIRFYCHNLGGYDIVFILKTLYLHNESLEGEKGKYKISLTLKDNKILKCIISKDKQKLVLIDSYPMLPKSLVSLGKDLSVETLKSK